MFLSLNMIELWDSFNDVFISRHFNLKNAILAQHKHLQRVKKANGQNSYLTYSFKYKNGQTVDAHEVNETKVNLLFFSTKQ